MKPPTKIAQALLNVLGDDHLSGRELAIKFKKATGKNISYGAIYTIMDDLEEARFVKHVDSRDASGMLRTFYALKR